MISSTSRSPGSHLGRLKRFIAPRRDDHRIYVKAHKPVNDAAPGTKTRFQDGEWRLSARAPGAPAPQDDEQARRQKAAWERRKARDFGYFLENVMSDVIAIGGSEAGQAHANLHKLKKAHPGQLPTVGELKSCLAVLDRASTPSSGQGGSPLPCRRQTDEHASLSTIPEETGRADPLSTQFLHRLNGNSITLRTPAEEALTIALANALNHPAATLNLTALHIPIPSLISSTITQIIRYFVSLRRHLNPPLQKVVLASDTTPTLARYFVQSAPRTPASPPDGGTPLPHWNSLQFQPDPSGALDWSSMDSATFEQLDAQGTLGQFIQTQARAIKRMILPAGLTTQPLLLQACPHLRELRFVKPAMGALNLSHMKDLRRVELLEPADHSLIAKTQVPFGCTVSSRARREKAPTPLSDALPSALAIIPASPVATRPGPSPAELFKRKASLLIPSGHASRPQLLRLIDSLGDHLDGVANTLSLDTWAPGLIDTFTQWGGMDLFASACDKANRRPGCLRTPTKQETLPPYAALLRPQVLVFSQPDAAYLDLSTLEGLKEVVVISSDGTDWANKVRLPPGDSRLVIKSGGF